jgi:hypothetical protein
MNQIMIALAEVAYHVARGPHGQNIAARKKADQAAKAAEKARQDASEPEGQDIHPAEEPVAAPDAPQDDQEAVRQRLQGRLGDETQASFAKKVGISIPTLRKVIEGKPVRQDSMAKIEAYLAR